MAEAAVADRLPADEGGGAPPVHAVEFRAMGSPCRVVVDRASAPVAEEVRVLVAALERRWSHFDGLSEVTALNRAAGRVTMVSPETYRLLSCAEEARIATGGRFHPLLLDQLRAAGYRRSWGDGPLVADPGPARPGTGEPIVLYPEMDAVRLPEGHAFDPGGIGKGLAVDLAIEHCLRAGVTTASVELGGDLRVVGRPWYGPAWTVAVENPFDPTAPIDDVVAAITPAGGGAVTTSTTTRRRWRVDGRLHHHLIDPATGRPGDTDLVSVTTTSGEAWWAEVVAKTAVLAGTGGLVDHLDRHDTPGVAVTATGRILVHRPDGPARPEQAEAA